MTMNRKFDKRILQLMQQAQKKTRKTSKNTKKKLPAYFMLKEKRIKLALEKLKN